MSNHNSQGHNPLSVSGKLILNVCGYSFWILNIHFVYDNAHLGFAFFCTPSFAQHAYGRFVGRCKAMGALELFVHFQTTEAGGHIICVHSKHPSYLVSGSPWSYLLPWSRPWRIPPEWQMSMQMFWDEYKEKAHVFYFEFLAESMSNMHSLIHAVSAFSKKNSFLQKG